MNKKHELIGEMLRRDRLVLGCSETSCVAIFEIHSLRNKALYHLTVLNVGKKSRKIFTQNFGWIKLYDEIHFQGFNQKKARFTYLYKGKMSHLLQIGMLEAGMAKLVRGVFAWN